MVPTSPKLSRVFLQQSCGERDPTRQISNHPTHGTHANVARSLSSTAASLALNSADTLSTCEQNTRQSNCPYGNKNKLTTTGQVPQRWTQ
jgi:hypothetical protein